MKPIEPRPDEPRPRLDSEDLKRLARAFSGRIQVECSKCRNSRRLNIQSREMRLGSSPDLSQIDPSQPGRPRLIFYCIFCQRIIGYLQGDEWTADDAADESATRWNHLELDEEKGR